MDEPQAATSAFGTTHPVAERKEQDRILARIKDGRRVSSWALPKLTETLAELRALPDQMAWVATRYLQSVEAWGDEVFTPPAGEQTSFDGPVRETLTCPCGGTAPVAKQIDARRAGERTERRRASRVGTCDGCGAEVVAYN